MAEPEDEPAFVEIDADDDGNDARDARAQTEEVEVNIIKTETRYIISNNLTSAQRASPKLAALTTIEHLRAVDSAWARELSAHAHMARAGKQNTIIGVVAVNVPVLDESGNYAAALSTFTVLLSDLTTAKYTFPWPHGASLATFALEATTVSPGIQIAIDPSAHRLGDEFEKASVVSVDCTIFGFANLAKSWVAAAPANEKRVFKSMQFQGLKDAHGVVTDFRLELRTGLDKMEARVRAAVVALEERVPLYVTGISEADLATGQSPGALAVVKTLGAERAEDPKPVFGARGRAFKMVLFFSVCRVKAARAALETIYDRSEKGIVTKVTGASAPIRFKLFRDDIKASEAVGTNGDLSSGQSSGPSLDQVVGIIHASFEDFSSRSATAQEATQKTIDAAAAATTANTKGLGRVGPAAARRCCSTTPDGPPPDFELRGPDFP